MSWLTRCVAVTIKTYQWKNHVQRALETLLPGYWRLYSDVEAHLIERCAFLGSNIMIKPNSQFFVNVIMNRKTYLADRFDSEVGHKDITFGCSIKASPHDKWPTFGSVIGYKDMLDTPYEVAKFVEESISNYREQSDDNGPNDNDDEPMPVDSPTGAVPVLV